MTRRWRIADADWNHWPDGLSDRQVWRAAAAEGVAGVELGVYVAAEELSARRIRRCAALAAESGVPVAAILLSLPANRWPDGAFTAHAGEVVAEVSGCAAACRRFGLSTLGVWPGADPAGAPWPAMVAGVRRARDAARRFGVRVAVEYKPATVVPDARAAAALADEVPGTGVLLDLAHAYAAGEEPADVVHKLGERLWHVHLGDATPGGADDDLPVGRVHDAGPVVAALDAVGFAGVAAFDLYGTACSGASSGRRAVDESLAHLRGRL